MPRKKSNEINDEKPKITKRKKKNIETIPVEVVETIPVEVVETIPVEVVETIPVEVVETIPVEVVETIPVEVVETIPVEVVETIPVEVIETIPVEVVETIPLEVVETIPVEVIETIPAEVVETIPVEVIETIPVEVIENNNFDEDNLIILNKTISYNNLNEKLNLSKLELLKSNKSNEENNIIKEFTLNNDELNNILKENLTESEVENKDNQLIEIENNYSFSDLQHIFKLLNEACMIIEINNGTIKYIEKKGNESRNQSVIDLLLKTNKHKKLPDVQFIIFTNDFIDVNTVIKYPYLLTFCRNNLYKTNLFPNFNFNHWLEANIGNYEDEYNYFISNQIEWSNKSDIVFWSGANTNLIRKKIEYSSKKYENYFINILDKVRSNNISIKDIVKNKYLLNMNGYSYGGRLNYLFLSGSCVIILKNMNEDKCYEEFFYKEFIPNVDYIDILYSDNEHGEIIIERINDAIKNNNCEEMAMKCYTKAKNIFKMTNIYDNIFNTLNYLSKNNIITNKLEHSLFFTPSLNYFFKDRLSINNNIINFNFKGSDFEMNIFDNQLCINIKLKNNITKIFYNNEIILEKYTPYIVNNNKIQNYKIIIEKNDFSILLNDKFKLINTLLPNDSFNGNSVEIKTDSEGLWTC